MINKQGNKRLVAVGRKFPPYHTLHFQFATSDPAWFGKTDMRWLNKEDPSDIRKLKLESSDIEDSGVE